jgi:hypothetical protein
MPWSPRTAVRILESVRGSQFGAIAGDVVKFLLDVPDPGEWRVPGDPGGGQGDEFLPAA